METKINSLCYTLFQKKLFTCDGCKYFEPENICKRRKLHYPLSTNAYLWNDVSECYTEQEKTKVVLSIHYL